MAAFELIGNTEVGGTPVTGIEFTGLSGYDHLYVVGSLKTDTTDVSGWDDVYWSLNGSQNDFSGTYYELSNTSPVSGTLTNSWLCRATNPGADAGFFNPFEAWLPNSSSTVSDKAFRINFYTLGFTAASTYWRVFKTAGTWAPATVAAIDELNVGHLGGTDKFTEHSNISIYGLNGAE